MRRPLAAAGIGAALLGSALLSSGVASAYPSADKDAEFISCTSEGGIYNRNGPTVGAAFGRRVANDISSGFRDPLAERDYVYRTTPTGFTVTDANVLVNCATSVYLGYGPGSTPPSRVDNGGTEV